MLVLQWRRKKLDWRQGMYLLYSDRSWIRCYCGWYRFIYNVTIRFCILDIELCVGCCGSEWFVICEMTDNDCWLITEWIPLTTDKGLTETAEDFQVTANEKQSPLNTFKIQISTTHSQRWFCDFIGSLFRFEMELETNLNLSWQYFLLIGQVCYWICVAVCWWREDMSLIAALA
jgi:hypothetical protein